MASYLTLSLLWVCSPRMPSFYAAVHNCGWGSRYFHNCRHKSERGTDREIKIINFADDTTIFLRDIDCLTRIQAILNLYEKASSSKINLSKSQAFDTKLNSPEIKWIQRLLDPANALWKDLMLYRLNLILNFNQG